MASTKKSGNRYSGADSQPWVVKTATGERVGTSTFTSYADAAHAARTHTETTGEFAGPARA